MFKYVLHMYMLCNEILTKVHHKASLQNFVYGKITYICKQNFNPLDGGLTAFQLVFHKYCNYDNLQRVVSTYVRTYTLSFNKFCFFYY